VWFMSQCSFGNCQRAVVLGILLPIMLCVFVYLGMFLYVIYATYEYNSIDIQQWQVMQINDLNRNTQAVVEMLHEQANNI
jgi:hypothetical protein